ncbi:Tetraketide alpha-pyrone reductase 2 [Penicillium rolfsii]|nr:Tetraketide alpha-pyrone reductase 2 [Penicillium rolfsii]
MQKSLVTGGSGFIALYVVKGLLERGDLVNTTVRSLKNLSKCKPLLDMQLAYPGRLKLFEADLLKDGSFLQAMEGCDIVYHVASPFLVPQQIKDGMKECVEPALQGTENVLLSVNKTESVKRVVLTSSIAAMYGDSWDILKMKDKTLSEDYWNTTSTASYSPYSYSKLVAEREAWKICDSQRRWDLVAINPGLVLGPSLTSESTSGSLFMLDAMYKGENRSGVPELHYPVADVRDVAEAHIRAGKSPSAKGRYIIASDKSICLLDMANYVRGIHQKPESLPTRNLPKILVFAAGPFIGLPMKWVSRNIGISYKVNNSKSIRDLGLSYRPAGELLKDHYLSWQDQQAHK